MHKEPETERIFEISGANLIRGLRKNGKFVLKGRH